MSNSNLPYGELVVHQLTPQHQAWIGMAESKNDLVATLTEKELAAQGILMVDKTSHVAIDAALLNYRKAHAEMVEERKGFTNQIDAGVIQPLMAFEKRVEPKVNLDYLALDKLSLQLRKAAADKAVEANAINQELASFKTHCTNEFFRTAADYRTVLRHEITTVYEYYLKSKIEPNAEQLRKHLTDVHIPVSTKFIPIRITSEQMMAIYNELHHPNYEEILEEMLQEAEKTFAHFTSDLANADAAIISQQQSSQLAEIAESKKVEDETAINTLIISSEAVVVDSPRIKATYQILVVESEQWAKSVIAGFISNLPAIAKYIRVKSWSKLSIGQMAEYLAKLATDTDVQIKGLTYKTIEK